jgi:hypothetical protein
MHSNYEEASKISDTRLCVSVHHVPFNLKAYKTISRETKMIFKEPQMPGDKICSQDNNNPHHLPQMQHIPMPVKTYG